MERDAHARSPLRVAFAGDAHVHVPDYVEACRSAGDVRIVGACLVGGASPFAFPGDVPIVGAPGDLPAHDLCVVTTDVASHERVAAGLTAPAVYVEKPLGTDASAARRVAALLRRDGRAVHLGFFLRRERALATLGARLRARRIGRLRRADLVYEHDGLRRGWLADWPAHLDAERMGHGAFGDLAGHLIDLCHETVGPLRPVRCGLRRAPGAAADSGGEALLRAAGGATVRLRCGADAPGVRLELLFAGDAGTLRLRDGTLTETIAGHARTLARDVRPTPASGFLAALAALRGSAGVRRGASLDEAIAVNRALDALRAVASVRPARRVPRRPRAHGPNGSV